VLHQLTIYNLNYSRTYSYKNVYLAVMCPSHLCRFRVESESQVLGVRVEPESSKIFSSRVRVMTWSNRVTKISSHFESLIWKLESMPSNTKFHVFSTTFFCYEMASNML